MESVSNNSASFHGSEPQDTRHPMAAEGLPAAKTAWTATTGPHAFGMGQTTASGTGDGGALEDIAAGPNGQPGTAEELGAALEFGDGVDDRGNDRTTGPRVTGAGQSPAQGDPPAHSPVDRLNLLVNSGVLAVHPILNWLASLAQEEAARPSVGDEHAGAGGYGLPRELGLSGQDGLEAYVEMPASEAALALIAPKIRVLMGNWQQQPQLQHRQGPDGVPANGNSEPTVADGEAVTAAASGASAPTAAPQRQPQQGPSRDLVFLNGDQVAADAFWTYIAPRLGDDPEATFVNNYFAGHHSSAIEFRAEMEPAPVLTFTGELKNPETGRPAGVMTCDIKPTEGIAVYRTLEIRRHDLTLKLLHNQIPLDKRIGLHRVDFLRTSKVDVYELVRCGFIPTTPKEWAELKENIRTRLKATEGEGSYKYGKTTREQRYIVNLILQSREPRAIWEIAALIPDVLHGRGRLTLGEALLLDQLLHGSLMLRDSEHMERFYAHVTHRDKYQTGWLNRYV
jgi:hypothetical protein